MPEGISPEDLNPVANKQEAQGLWADGKRMFALNEMDEKLTTITSKAMLDSYSADAIGWMEPEQATAPSQRFMPERTDEDLSLRLLQTKETLRDWATSQESWKDWYSEHQETLDEFFGDYAGLFQEILAVTSQAASVKANVGLALKAFGQLMRNEEFDGKLRGEEKSGYLPAVIKNLNAIKNKTQVGGRKISNYKSANEGDSSRVVVDRHIARMLFGVDTPSAKQYAKAEAVLSAIAKEIGWEPAQVQAALWAQSIVMSGKDPVSYGAYLKSLESKKLTKKELISGLKGNQLTRRIGELGGSGYGSNEIGTERGRYSPPSKNATQGEGGVASPVRLMPEPLPANYQSSRDTTFLYQSIGPDGIINLSRPIKSTEALPTISTRHEYPMEEFTVSKFDRRASILYTKNKNGEGVAFKFDPQLMNEPEFADFDDLYEGAVVQLAMADRHGATDGDMGGHAFPDLKVNQDILVDDGNGKQYKLVWSNNAWGPVKNMSTKAQKYGATTLLTYNMDQHAHDSNTRTVRIFSNEIANSNLSAKDQSTLLIVMNVALKKAQSSANKQDLRALLKTKKDLIDLLKKDDKAISQAKGYVGKKPLSSEERLALENEIEGNQKDIDDENQFLKESLGVKLAGDEEVKVDALFRDYQNKRRAYEKNTKSESRKKAMVDAEKALKAYQKTKEFKKAEGLLPSRELDRFSNTFKGRKSLILAVKNKEASVKWHGFDSQKISRAIGDQLTGDSLHIVSSVELSSDPNFKAVYLGDDPREIARMSPSEQKAALQLKANPNLVAHEAYLWSMLGPAESKHIYNTNQRSVLESFPDFVNEYSKLPVKPGKLKLNDPNSKASEFNIVNTIRDQSKIGIVFRAEKGKNKETKSQRNGRQ
jgi:hypothetical protein